jgi:hypothetical protein
MLETGDVASMARDVWRLETGDVAAIYRGEERGEGRGKREEERKVARHRRVAYLGIMLSARER